MYDVRDEVMDELLVHAQLASPYEAVGLLLASDDGDVHTYVPLHNASRVEGAFEIEPQTIQKSDDDHVIVVHSHPIGVEVPSRSDILGIGEWAGKPYAVFSPVTGRIAFWRIERDMYTQIL